MPRTIKIDDRQRNGTHLFRKGSLAHPQEHDPKQGIDPSGSDWIHFIGDGVDEVLHVHRGERLLMSDLVVRLSEEGEIPVFHTGTVSAICVLTSTKMEGAYSE